MGQYTTNLDSQQESAFQTWVKNNKVPFDPSDKADYDMRGYWKGLQTNDPIAKQSLSQFDGKMHFPDKWKTPYHKTLSNESIYAPKDAPHWVGNKLIDKTGKIVADETPSNGNVRVKGPDGKVYNFPKGTTKDQAVSYFKKNKSKSFATGPGQSLTTSNPATIKKFEDRAKKTQFEATHKQKPGSLLGEELINQIPNVAAGGMSMLGAGKTNPVGMGLAGIGGMGGEAISQMLERAFYPEKAPQTSTEAATRIAKEGASQTAIEGVGRALGPVLFKVAQKLPHAKIVNGIPLTNYQATGDTFSKFLEDMGRNVWPASRSFDKFTAEQTAKIAEHGRDVGDLLGKFRGSREQLGEMIKKVVKYTAKQQEKSVDPAKYLTKELYEAAVDKVKNHFNSGLLGTISKTMAPEGITELLVNDGFGHKQVREVIDYLAEHKSHTLAYARSGIWADMINKAMRSTTDPTLKGSKMVDDYLGTPLRKEMDKVGEERLRSIFSDLELDTMKEFSETISRVGKSGQGWIGRFKNFVYVTGLLAGGGHGVVAQGGLFHILGKVMTNPDGAKAYENVIKGQGGNIVRTGKAAVDAYKTYVDHAKREYEYEKAKAEEEYRNRHKT